MTESEYALFALTPETELVDLAVELDFVPDAEIDRRQLLNQLVPRLLELAQREGLPLSKYDADDLEELPSEHRAALAGAIGCGSSVPDLLKNGARVYRKYYKRRKSAVAQMLPSLLSPLARHAHEAV